MYKQNKFTPAQKEVTRLLGRQNVLTDSVSRALHGYDCSLDKTVPDAVLKITRAEQVGPLLKILYKHNVPFTARASATNHVGGCVALNGGVIINLASLNKILKIDTENAYADVECSVINLDLQRELAKRGFYYAPDPASERICTIGGNAAMNAGGARGLKYGATAEHILSADYCAPSGSVHQISGPLLGLIIGAEGTLGLCTRFRVKITKKEGSVCTMLSAFCTIDDAMRAVCAVIAAGIIPRAIEAMDRLTINMLQAHADYGYPDDCEALLLIETDGRHAKKEISATEEICKKYNSYKTIVAKNDAQKEALWRGRRAGYAAMAVKSSNVFVEDGTVPRKELPGALLEARQITAAHGLTMGLFFHAGDGNLHPNIVFDARNMIETKKVLRAGKEMLASALKHGGTISGEHGVGVEKRAAMALMYSKNEIEIFQKIKRALDPKNLCNPLKVIPLSQSVKEPGELRVPPEPEIDAENGVVTVAAEMKLDALVKTLSAEKFYLRAPKFKGTLAELFESGSSPEFSFSVTGLQAAGLQGQSITYGGKYVKNSAGYNLIRLFGGTRGVFAKTKVLTLKIYREKQAASYEEKPSALSAPLMLIKKEFDL